LANILFTWELGAGSGHVAPYTNLVNLLEQQGHKVYYVLKYLNQSHLFFKDTQVTYFQAPGEYRPVIQRVRNSNSAAKILYNAGFGDVDFLTALIRSWQNLYALINPDLIIFDYSPTAMLAARNGQAKRLAIGTGFHLPPEMQPIPSIWSELGINQDKDDTSEVKTFEEGLLGNINAAAAKNDIAPLSHFYELYDADLKIFRTYKEMDHYQCRAKTDYAGALRSAPGAEPEWPTQSGPKIFAYLKPFKTLPKLLEKINSRKFPTLIYGDGLSARMKKEFSSNNLHFSEQRLDMDAIGETADLAICNAGHSACCELLLSGVPILLLPLNLEQHMVAKNVQNLGAGLNAPKLAPDGMTMRLRALIKDTKYREAAQAFAKKYANDKSTASLEQIADTVNTLLETA